MKRFWTIHVPGLNIPHTLVFDTLDLAMAAARDYAKTYVGKTISVMESVNAVQAKVECEGVKIG